MLSTRIHLLWSRLLVTNTCRCLYTDPLMMRRYGRRDIPGPEEEPPEFSDPGIAFRASAFKDDPEIIEKLANDDMDIDDLDSDFQNLDRMYDEHTM